MTHELKNIVSHFEQRSSDKAVLATVVALDGSSYRRPGVRMLIFENGDMVGAVSGGCVEKEVLCQSLSVFTNGTSKVMIYDGRYRLGCEGILYILLEVFDPDETFLSEFWSAIQQRHSFHIQSHFKKEQSEHEGYFTQFQFDEGTFPVNKTILSTETEHAVFEQKMHPCFQLVIIGAEHDAVQLCSYASLTGWEVTVVANPREEKAEKDFLGIHKLVNVEPEAFELTLDEQTAVVIMTHSFAKDLQFLMALKDEKGAYIGLLGPYKRREKLFGALIERHPDISDTFLEQIHGPAGLDIGAETPQEIAISIMSEILSVVNKKQPFFLKQKVGAVHS